MPLDVRRMRPMPSVGRQMDAIELFTKQSAQFARYFVVRTRRR